MKTTEQILERLQYIEHAPLPCVCGETGGTLYSSPDRHGLKTSLRVCASCGLVRTDPAPDDASLERFYREDYRALFDAEGPDALWASQVEQGRALLQMLRGRLPERATVIDYGCGIGGVLQAFSEAGHRVFGVEPGEYAEAGRAKLGGRIYRDSSTFGDGCADVVIALHTIEHRRDLADALADHRRLLKPGGILVCEVPTLETIDTHYKTLRNYLQLPHLWHFDVSTFADTLRRAGFVVDAMVSHRLAIARRFDAGSAFQLVTALTVESKRDQHDASSAKYADKANAMLASLVDPDVPTPFMRALMSQPKPPALKRFARWLEGASLVEADVTEQEIRNQVIAIDAMRQRLMIDVDDAAARLQARAGARTETMDHDPVAAAEHGVLMQAAQEVNDVITVARAQVMAGGGA